MELKKFFKDFEPKSDKNTSHCYIDKYYSEEFSDKKELPIKLMDAPSIAEDLFTF